MTGLIRTLSQDGDAIEADFQEHYGLDLAAEAARGRYKRLWRLLSQLPEGSRYAAQIASQGRQGASQPPNVDEWPRDSQLLASISDQLAIANWQRGGGKSKKPDLLTDPKRRKRKRPAVTAVDVFGAEAVKAAIDRLGGNK